MNNAQAPAPQINVPLPAGLDPANLDPNVYAMLALHMQEHQATLEQAQARAEAERLRREEESTLRQELERVPKCEGATAHSVREWLQELESSIPYFVPARHDAITHKLIAGTARGGLRRTYDQFMDTQVNRANVTRQAVLLHLANAFLGGDENAVLREELKGITQGKKEEAPAYGRRFSWMAGYAYPVPQRNPEQERDMADIFMANLLDGKIKDSCFEHQPPLVTLNAAITHADNEYERQKRRERVTRQYHRGPEPMEIAALGVTAEIKPLRDELRSMREEVAALRKETSALRKDSAKKVPSPPMAPPAMAPPAMFQPQAPPPQQYRSYRPQGGNFYGPPRNGSAGTGACYECGFYGHYGRECPERAARLAREAQGN